MLQKPNFPNQKCQRSCSPWYLQSFKKHFKIKESYFLGVTRSLAEKIKATSQHTFHSLVFSTPADRKEGKHSPQRAGSTWISAAYGESRFFRLTSVLWAPTLHQSQCQGPFLCSFDTGQHFLQENKSYMSLMAPHQALCSKQTSIFIQCLLSSLINNREANGFCH